MTPNRLPLFPHFESTRLEQVHYEQLCRNVNRIHARYGQGLVSAVHCWSPYFKDVALVVVADQIDDISNVLRIANEEIPERVRVFCTRESEIPEVAAIHAYHPTLFALPYWLCFQSTTLHGKSLQGAMPLPSFDMSLLRFHVTYSLFHFRNRVVLARMGSRLYKRLIRELEKERLMWMLTALLTRGIWNIAPQDIEKEFLRTFPVPVLERNSRKFRSAVRKALLTRPGPGRRSLAMRAVWLTERLSHHLLELT